MKKLLCLLLSVVFIFTTTACSNTGVATNTKNQKHEMDTDLVIIGGGSSGLAAAIQASQSGVKDIIILEKLSMAGGCLNFSEGAFAVQSTMQKERGINYTTDHAFEENMKYNHWNSNARLVRTYIENSGEMVDWMIDIGARFSDISLSQGKPDTLYWHMYEGSGHSITKVFLENIERAGIKLLYETPATSLIMDNGKVAGVKAKDKDGNEIEIKSKAVIIATGGFGNNTEMLKKYTGINAEDILYLGQPGHDGDGINMAYEVGAAEFGSEYIQVVNGTVEGEPFDSSLSTLTIQPYLGVNKSGIRFFDEMPDIVQDGGNVLLNQPENMMYLLFDSNAVKEMSTNELMIGRKLYPHSTGPITTLESDLKTGIEAGKVFSSDTIEGLAKELEMDSEVLNNTIEEYNSLCEEGHDKWFNKEPKYLKPITDGPFYALKIRNCFLGTLGGIKINENTEVINTEDRVIPGLYAIGADAGGLYGDNYDFGMSGFTSGFSIVSGRIAAKNVAKYINK